MRLLRRNASRPRRRWWQKFIRISILVVLVLGGLYATLPWWMPTDWLRDRIARDMSRQTGAPVEIGQMRLSWFHGVTLEGLTIQAPDGRGPVAVVERVRTDFSPVDVVVHKRIEWMEVMRPCLFVRWYDDGRSTLDALAGLEFDLECGLMRVKGAEAVFDVPGREDPLLLKVGSLEVHPGKLGQLGRVTMAARIRQESGDATLSVRFTDRPVDPEVGSAARVNFANLDLNELRLPELLGLPLERLAGRCRGSARVRLMRANKEGRFDLELAVTDLDAQPVRGPDLAVIKQAGVALSGSIDPVATEEEAGIEVASARIELPGIDLSGSGSALFGTALRLLRLDAQGRIDPERLAALLTGPGARGLRVDGPVEIRRLELRRDGPRAELDLAIDATAAALHADGRVLKPGGEPMRARLKAVLDDRGGRLTVADSRVELGGNWIEHEGQYTDVFPAAAGLFAGRPRAVLGVETLRCAGRWQVTDLPALARLSPELARLLEPVELDGAVRGQWNYAGRTGEPGRFEADLVFDAAGRVALGGAFVKTAGQPVRLSASGRLLRRGSRPEDLDADLAVKKLDLAVGAGRLHTDGLLVQLRTGADGSPVVAAEADGRFDIRGAEHLLACVPAPELRGTVRGGILRGGRYKGHLTDGRLQAAVEAELMDLGLEFPGRFRKPVGEAARVSAGLAAEGGKARAELNLTLNPPGDGRSELDLRVRAVTDDTPDAALRAENIELDVVDAEGRWLARRFPAVAAEDVPKGLRVSGRLLADVSDPTAPVLTLDERGPLSLELAGSALRAWGSTALVATDDADQPLRVSGFDLHLGGRVAPSEGLADALDRLGAPEAARLLTPGDAAGAAGAALSFAADARSEDGRRVEIRLSEENPLTASLGESELRLSGTAAVDGKHLRDGSPLAETVPELDMALAGRATLADVLHVWPGAAEPARRFGLAGGVESFAIHLVGEGDVIRVGGTANAKDLVVRLPDGFRKPAGLPATAEWDAKLSSDLTTLHEGELSARVGDARVTVRGSARRTAPADGRPAEWLDAEATVTASTEKAESLAELLPRLAPYALAGGAEIEASWRLEDGRTIDSVLLRADDLEGRWGGRAFGLDGTLTLERFRPPAEEGALPAVARMEAERLYVRLGDSRGFVLGDVADPLGSPRGRVRFLGESVDTVQFGEWLDGLGEEPSGPAAAPAPRERARGTLAALRRRLGEAELEIEAQLRRMRYHDDSVDVTYDVREVGIEALVDRGSVEVAYRTGLSGGLVRGEMRVDLNAEEPVLETSSEMRELIVTEKIQPHIANFFPGNDVEGRFSHTERMSVALLEALARGYGAEDAACPTGTARNVAIKGTVTGRAAPEFVTAIFPGLNLATYSYKRMTGFAEFREDGSAANDMIFRGTAYDLYIEGVTDADNIGRYEIGVILPPSIQSAEWNHVHRLGRIPVLKFKARIEGGEMHDTAVSYLRPDEIVASILLWNNPLYVALFSGSAE